MIDIPQASKGDEYFAMIECKSEIFSQQTIRKQQRKGNASERLLNNKRFYVQLADSPRCDHTFESQSFVCQSRNMKYVSNQIIKLDLNANTAC